ncbi:MAG: BON domain-containing protein [Deltaproteobacteria bacterium]|nr:BON domain-containing protein [Deltaproteobacteria bacterium]
MKTMFLNAKVLIFFLITIVLPMSGASIFANINASDQKNNKADIDLSAKIRRDIMNNDDLSFNAKNIKIITRDGNVTLKGDVNNVSERSWIEQRAQAIAGEENVKNELAIATPLK